jgi:hypothetical protein
VTETRTGEQIEIWKKELAIAIADEQWRLALKLCSWLRYALSQRGLSDPEVEEAHRRSKEGLAEQVSREKIQQERKEEHERKHRRLRRKTMHQIVSGDWNQALDSIEVLYQDGADRQEAIHLLRELEARLATLLSPGYRQVDQRSAALVRRFDELVERVGGGPLTSRSRPQDTSIG